MEGKLLIVGSGSIGRRHTKNARKLGVSVVICDTDFERAKEVAEEVGAEGCYSSYQEACEKEKDIAVAVIATPSQFHIEQAIFLSNREVHILVEKPLAVEMNGIDSLIKIIHEKNVVAMMAQSYRFHEGYLLIKKMLNDQVIGKVYHVNLFGGHYLPDWHPMIDYRIEYTAQKKLGGGALLTSMSHTFDSVCWLFGEVQELIGWKAKLSDLEIDVDDSVFCLMKTNQHIIIECQTDFLQRVPEHRMVIVGEKGTIHADFIQHTILIGRAGKEEPEVIQYAFDPNKRYFDELRHFIFLVDQKVTNHDLDIYAGKRVVELLLNDKITAML